MPATMGGIETRTTVPGVGAEQAIGIPGAVVVDLRSPAEFAEDHLPGAVSVPLFDDVERAVIGTLYKKESPEAAFAEGRAVTRGRIGSLVTEVAALAGWDLPASDLSARVDSFCEGGLAGLGESLQVESAERLPERPVIFHCWRGGMRSRSVTAFLRGLGLQRSVVLTGGYRAWRQHVTEALAAWEAPPTFVLRGLTGVGKTLVLRELERIRPGWTVDLEGLAGHRSSILGMVGQEPCSQKAFETRLERRLAAGFPGPCVFEGESRKVGDVTLPERAWAALIGGTNIRLTAPEEVRVRVLIDDYLLGGEGEEAAARRAEMRTRLPFIEKRLGASAWDGRLVGLLDAGQDAELTRLLLEHYYDPLYLHSEKGRSHAATIDTSDPAAAAQAVAECIEAGLD